MSTTHGNNAEERLTQVPLQAIRSGNFTVSATDVSNGYAIVNVAFPTQYADTNYTIVGANVETLTEKGPTAAYQVAQLDKTLSSVTVVVKITNGQAGDKFVVHLALLHD